MVRIHCIESNQISYGFKNMQVDGQVEMVLKCTVVDNGSIGLEM